MAHLAAKKAGKCSIYSRCDCAPLKINDLFSMLTETKEAWQLNAVCDPELDARQEK